MHTWIEVASFDLMQNVRTVRSAVGESIALFAVVKSNAYGHDFGIATESFWRAGVDGFVVQNAHEALQLVEKRYRVPILVLTPPEGNELWKLVQAGVRFSAINREFIEQLKGVASRYEKPAFVHIELETGMHRFGLSEQEVYEVFLEAQRPDSGLKVEGLFTHLYAADNEDRSHEQIKRLSDCLFEIQRRGLPVPASHVLASDGFLKYPDALFDGVRIGRALYGIRTGDFYTRSALTWKTKIVHMQRLKRGETVSYGGTHVADRDTMIATLPIGYHDGVDRSFSNKGWVLVKGKKCPIIGTVCMNNTMVDLSAVMHPLLCEEVVMLGTQGNESITPSQMAEWKGTIDYEILAQLPVHTPRIKVK